MPGNRAYLVEIDPSNFASGGPLVGFVFSNDKNTTPTNSGERQQFFLLGNPENKTDVDFGLYCKFDLALVKILATGQSNMITAGANVTFTLAVFNQGVVTATNISLVDYLPTGFTLSTSGNSGWVNNGATATLAVPGDLAPNGTYLKDIVLTAGAIPTGTYTNTAEITAATAPGNTPLPDIDSTPDNVNGNGSNGNSGESAALVDDQTSGDGKQAGQDEDDHDIATVTITPLPLTASYVIAKKLETIDPVSPNVWLTFTIDITNTGGLPITFLPLHDVYQTGYLAYLGATPAADDLINDGQIDWHDLAASFGQPLQAGQAFHLKVRFMALHDTTVLPGGATPNTVSAHNAKTNNTPVTDPPPSTASVRILAPTAVALANHSAVYASNQVLLHWQTESETQAVGYHIWRIDDASGEAVKLTEQLLVAQKAGQNAGAAYDFVDKSAQAGHSYRYVLEVVDNEGNVSYNELGQITAGSRLFLPVLVRH